MRRESFIRTFLAACALAGPAGPRARADFLSDYTGNTQMSDSAVKGVEEYRSGKVKQVSGFTVVDRYQMQVTLNHAPAPFVSFVAIGAAKILPRDVAEAQGEAFGQRPIGTGPFRFVSWEHGKEVTLAANPEYFGGAPKLARVATCHPSNATASRRRNLCADSYWSGGIPSVIG